MPDRSRLKWGSKSLPSLGFYETISSCKPFGPSLIWTSFVDATWLWRSGGLNVHRTLYRPACPSCSAVMHPLIPFLIIVEVAPLTTHAPWVTRTTTSFGVRVFSVSLKSALLVMSSAPSAAAVTLTSPVIPEPHAHDAPTSTPN